MVMEGGTSGPAIAPGPMGGGGPVDIIVAPKPAQMSRKAERYWREYSEWVYGIEERRTTELSTTRALMGAQGVQFGSDAWNAILGDVNSAYDKEIAELNKGFRFNELSRYRQQYSVKAENYLDFFKDTPDLEKPSGYSSLADEYNDATGKSLVEFYTGMFGAYEPPGGLSDDDDLYPSLL